MAKQDTLGLVLNVAAAAMIGVATYFAFAYAPTAQQDVGGDAQRIFYFHVGVAWIAGLALLVTFVASVLYLWRGEQRKHDILAVSSVEIGVTFGVATIVAGMFWARPAWGVWWTWEPRLTTTAITLFLYVAYLMLRGAIDDPQRRGRIAAVYGIVAFASVPVTFFATQWWSTVHPPPVSMTPTMRAAMFVAVGAFTLLYAALLRARVRLENSADEVAALKQQALSG
jgi:heme exporter protein C